MTYSGSSDCGDTALHADHFGGPDGSNSHGGGGPDGSDSHGDGGEPKTAARLEGQIATLRIIIIVMAFVLLVMGAMLIAQRSPALFVGVGMPAAQPTAQTVM